jgi:hypothetical protein
MDMNHGCVVVVLVLEDVHYGVFKLVVYERPKKCGTLVNLSDFFPFA